MIQQQFLWIDSRIRKLFIFFYIFRVEHVWLGTIKSPVLIWRQCSSHWTVWLLKLIVMPSARRKSLPMTIASLLSSITWKRCIITESVFTFSETGRRWSNYSSQCGPWFQTPSLLAGPLCIHVWYLQAQMTCWRYFLKHQCPTELRKFLCHDEFAR